MSNGSNTKWLTTLQVIDLKRSEPETPAAKRLVARLRGAGNHKRHNAEQPIHIPRSVARQLKLRKLRDA